MKSMNGRMNRGMMIVQVMKRFGQETTSSRCEAN